MLMQWAMVGDNISAIRRVELFNSTWVFKDHIHKDKNSAMFRTRVITSQAASRGEMFRVVIEVKVPTVERDGWLRIDPTRFEHHADTELPAPIFLPLSMSFSGLRGNIDFEIELENGGPIATPPTRRLMPISPLMTTIMITF